jgi:hypothetical protein
MHTSVVLDGNCFDIGFCAIGNNYLVSSVRAYTRDTIGSDTPVENGRHDMLLAASLLDLDSFTIWCPGYLIRLDNFSR